MSAAKPNTDAADASRRKIFIITAIASALLIAALVFWATRSPSSGGAGQQPRLAGAIRADSPEFAQIRERLVVDFNPDDHAFESTRAIGDIVINIIPKVRNFTGRTINGLELQATVIDLGGNPLQQRTVIAIPARESELEPNKVMEVPIRMEGFQKDQTRANIKVEVTGVTFKQ